MKKVALVLIIGWYASTAYAQEETQRESINKIDKKQTFNSLDVSEKAEFAGGEDSLQRFSANSIRYPKQALDSRAQGTVIVVFVVNTDGSVTGVNLLGRKKGSGLDEEAMRVIRLISRMWKPAMLNNKPVRMRFRMPIKF